MHPTEDGFLGVSDVGCPVGSVGLLRSGLVEGQETLPIARMLGLYRKASQIIQGVAPSVQIGVGPWLSPFQWGDTLKGLYHTGAIRQQYYWSQ